MDTDGDAPGRQPGPGHSRRWVLAGGGAAILAAGAGVAVGFVQPVHERAVPPLPPAALTAAIADERQLLANVTATLRAQPQQRAVLAQLRRDHATHLRALLAAAVGYSQPASQARPAGTASRGRSLQRSALRAAERRAASAAATRAGHLDGQHAALLASISACEATHALLLEPVGHS